MIGVGEAINSLRPSTAWSLDGNNVDNIVWHTKGVEPLTNAEVANEVVRLKKIEARASVERARQAAYQQTADPIFFEYQRGDATEAQWLAAVQAVKDAYPYPQKPEGMV